VQLPGPRSHTSVHVCVPAGAVEVPVVVSFTAPDSKGLSIVPIQLTLHATGKELPVSTLTPVVDFRSVWGQGQLTAHH